MDTPRKSRSPKSDPQREELYQMEYKGLPGLSRAIYTREHHADLLRMMSKAFGVPQPELRWSKTNDWSGMWHQGVITLSSRPNKSGRSPITLIHEFSHHVIAYWDEHEALHDHGPEFVGVYGDALGMAGLIPWHGWQHLCKQYKVKCLDTTAIRTVNGLERVVKKRAAFAARKL